MNLEHFYFNVYHAVSVSTFLLFVVHHSLCPRQISPKGHKIRTNENEMYEQKEMIEVPSFNTGLFLALGILNRNLSHNSLSACGMSILFITSL